MSNNPTSQIFRGAKKRILIFSLVYYPRFIGGAEIAIKEITDRINPSEVDFHMITLHLDKSLPKEERVGNVRVFRIGSSKYLFTVIGFLKAVSLHKKFNYDATWSMMASYNGFAAMFFKKRFPKVPFILSLQEGDPIDYIKGRVGIFYPLFKRIFTKADLVQTISHYLANFARSMGYKGRVEVIPNGVDTKHFEAGQYSVLAKDKVILITTSRLVVKNAIGNIISAVQFLPENVKLKILGQGYEEKNLKSQVKKLKLENRIEFLGYISHEDMPQYLNQADIFIRPSLSEGFGNSFIEAMAAGLPVIATPVGGIVDFLFDPDKNREHPPTGLFCEVKNPQSIARQVERLMKNKNLRDTIVGNAKRMVKEKYDWNLVADQMKKRVFKPFL